MRTLGHSCPQLLVNDTDVRFRHSSQHLCSQRSHLQTGNLATSFSNTNLVPTSLGDEDSVIVYEAQGCRYAVPIPHTLFDSCRMNMQITLAIYLDQASLLLDRKTWLHPAKRCVAATTRIGLLRKEFRVRNTLCVDWGGTIIIWSEMVSARILEG